MDKHYVMWIKAECPFCVDARDELFRQRVDHSIYIMDDKPEELENLKKLWDYKTVPIIVLRTGDNEELIGGFTDLKEWFSGEENND